MTYRTAINHTACDGYSRRKLKAFPLQCLVNLAYVVKLVSALGRGSPRLYKLEDLVANVLPNSRLTNGLE
jgi:hypothetical protein